MNSSTVVSQELNYQAALLTLSAIQFSVWPPQATVCDEATYDYIIVGAGPTGCVIANRLTEDRNVNVLLLEAGGDPHYETLYAGYSAETQKTKMDYNYTSEYSDTIQECHVDGSAHLYLGKVLGGTSSLNLLTYERGNPNDFIKWSDAANDSTWLWENVVPYYKKAENLCVSCCDNLDSTQYGDTGYVSLKKDHHKEIGKYLEALADIGRDVVPDLNAHTFVGFSASMLASSRAHKQTAAYAFLRTAKNRPNLHVRKQTLVTKVLVDKNKTAYGVEAMLENNNIIKLYARNKVIVCAGVIKSPQLLMLSGIGPREELECNNIDVIADLPVGFNLQVQPGVVIEHRTDELHGLPLLFDPEDYGAGLITGMVSLDRMGDYPDYQTLSYISLNPEATLKYCAFYYGFLNEICDKFYDVTRYTESFFSVILNLKSKSRGSVQLKSLDPEDLPDIKFNLYSDHDDLENMIDYVMDYMEIENSSFFQRVGAIMVDATPNCGPFMPKSRDYWRCYIPCMTTTVAGRYTGTCAMGAVVDSRLRVYGVNNLHVADASVMPSGPSAGLYAPAVMIGEKLVDMIKNDCA